MEPEASYFPSLSDLSINAYTEVALTARATGPRMLLPRQLFMDLSVEAKAYVASYPHDSNETPLESFTRAAYRDDIIAVSPLNQKTKVGVKGEKLIDCYLESQFNDGSLYDC